jgi:hypothetical protein
MRKTLWVVPCILILALTGCSSQVIEPPIISSKEQTSMNAEGNDIDKSFEELPVADDNVNSMPIKEERVNDGQITSKAVLYADKVKVHYVNNTENSFIFGPAYNIECLENDKWEAVAPLPNVAYYDLGFRIAPGNEYEEIIDINASYSKLSSGRYRLIKKMSSDNYSIKVISEFSI